MPRKRASATRRARRAALKEQNSNLQRVVIFRVDEIQIAEPHVDAIQVAEPHVDAIQVAEPYVDEFQIAEPQAFQPPAINQKLLEERKRRATEIFNCIRELHRKVPPQLLPPVNILAQQVLRSIQFDSIQPVSPSEDEDVLQLAFEDEA